MIQFLQQIKAGRKIPDQLGTEQLVVNVNELVADELPNVIPIHSYLSHNVISVSQQ